MPTFSIEMSVQEGGPSLNSSKTFTNLSRGYLRDFNVEYEDILKWTKAHLITIAFDVLNEEQEKGFDKTPIILVDGSKTKKLADVSPLGKIEFISRQNISEILTTAYQAILDLSPVKSGLYKDSHYVFLNGTNVATNLVSLQSWLAGNPEIKDNDLIRIVNIQPYGRKLELAGITAGKEGKSRTSSRREDKGRRRGVKTGILIKKPNGAYQLAMRRVSKFKKNVGINFQFISGAQLGFLASEKNKTFKTGRNKKSIGRHYLYPSLIFKISGGGLFDV